MALTKKKLTQSTWTVGKNKPALTQSTWTAAGKGAPTPPAPAAPAFTPPKFSGDAQMFSSIGDARFQRDTELAELATANAQDTQQNQNYLRQLAENQSITDANVAGDAAKRGLSYSGALAKRIADNAMATRELGAKSSAQLAAQISARGSRYQQLTQRYGDPANPNDSGSYGLEQEGLARERFLASDPAGNVTAPAPAAPAGRPTSGNAKYPYKNSKTGEAYRDQTINGKKYHVYANGKQVRVG